MFRHIVASLLCALLPCSSLAQSVSSPEKSSSTVVSEGGSRLPVKRVMLYKNGVGYFEHSTRVHGNQELNIDFTTAQLNDVLKSLTVVDLGEGRIAGVRYNSIAPLEERLKALRLPFGEKISRSDYLAALRGARVEVHSGSSTAVGKLLSVETEDRKDDKKSYTATLFSVVTDSSEMRNFELGPNTSVRVTDRDLSEEVSRYMNLIGSSRAKDLRRMTISDTGAGDRNVFVSYISEVPIWKSTYRIILPEKSNEKPLLQGWAIVDNTVGEDWKDVQLSLIAGAPQSFVQQISQPYYVPRPVVGLPEAVMLTPQAHEGTMSNEESMLVNRSGIITGAHSDQSGITLDTTDAAVGSNFDMRAVHDMPIQGRSAADLIALTPGIVAANQPQAQAKDLGDYFEYNVTQPITIGKNQSALVPILQSRVQAEKVTIWNENSHEVRRALWLTNSSGLTLDAGTFNILDSGTFAGEGLIDTLHPDERRLISYAGDTAVRITMEQSSYAKPITHIRMAKGIMIISQESRELRQYTVHNADTQPRQVILEHPARANWKIADDKKAEETSASFLRFRVPVQPGKTETFKLEESYPGETHYELSFLDDNQVNLFSQQPLTPAIRDVFRRVLDQKNQIKAIEGQISTRRNEVETINKEQGRVRENMKVLKGTAEERALLQRYTRQLDSQEDRLNVLSSEIAGLQDKKDKANEQFEQMLQQIVMDESL